MYRRDVAAWVAAIIKRSFVDLIASECGAVRDLVFRMFDV